MGKSRIIVTPNGSVVQTNGTSVSLFPIPEKELNEVTEKTINSENVVSKQPKVKINKETVESIELILPRGSRKRKSVDMPDFLTIETAPQTPSPNKKRKTSNNTNAQNGVGTGKNSNSKKLHQKSQNAAQNNNHEKTVNSNQSTSTIEIDSNSNNQHFLASNSTSEQEKFTNGKSLNHATHTDQTINENQSSKLNGQTLDVTMNDAFDSNDAKSSQIKNGNAQNSLQKSSKNGSKHSVASTPISQSMKDELDKQKQKWYEIFFFPLFLIVFLHFCLILSVLI